MSVWQEWLISLATAFPSNEREHEITNLVYELFGILLYHAIRLEYGKYQLCQFLKQLFRRMASLGRYISYCPLKDIARKGSFGSSAEFRINTG